MERSELGLAPAENTGKPGRPGRLRVVNPEADSLRRSYISQFLTEVKADVQPNYEELSNLTRRVGRIGINSEELARRLRTGANWIDKMVQGRPEASLVTNNLAKRLKDGLQLSDSDYLYFRFLQGLEPEGLSPEEYYKLKRTEQAEEYGPLTEKLNPLPAIVYNRYGEVISINNTFNATIGEINSTPWGTQNILLWLELSDKFTDSGDWKTFRSGLLANQFNDQYRFLNTPHMTRLVNQLSSQSTEFANWFTNSRVKIRQPLPSRVTVDPLEIKPINLTPIVLTTRSGELSVLIFDAFEKRDLGWLKTAYLIKQAEKPGEVSVHFV